MAAYRFQYATMPNLCEIYEVTVLQPTNSNRSLNGKHYAFDLSLIR